MVFFHQNTLAGEWRAQKRCCEEQEVALHRNIAFALAVADLLELPDDLPLMPAVMAALSVPICLGNPGSLAHLKQSRVLQLACPMKLTADHRKGSLLNPNLNLRSFYSITISGAGRRGHR